VLHALVRAKGPSSVTALAKAAAMPVAKAHKYLASYVRVGLVEQIAHSGLYDLGPMAMEMGLAAINRLDVSRHAEGELLNLRDMLDETVTLAVWGNHGPTIIRWYDSSRAVSVNVRVGSVLPLLSSASGRIFLAHFTGEKIDIMARKELADERHAVRRTVKEKPGTDFLSIDPRSMDEVTILRETILSNGVARIDGVMVAGVSAIAAPVFDHNETISATLSVVGTQGALDISLDGEPIRALKAAAANLSARLGKRPSRTEG
jgi:DNA-binding IclR family transcriptional regulator